MSTSFFLLLTIISLEQGYIYAGLLGLMNLTATFFVNITFMSSIRVGLQVKAALNDVVRKICIQTHIAHTTVLSIILACTHTYIQMICKRDVNCSYIHTHISHKRIKCACICILCGPCMLRVILGTGKTHTHFYSHISYIYFCVCIDLPEGHSRGCTQINRHRCEFGVK